MKITLAEKINLFSYSLRSANCCVEANGVWAWNGKFKLNFFFALLNSWDCDLKKRKREKLIWSDLESTGERMGSTGDHIHVCRCRCLRRPMHNDGRVSVTLTLAAYSPCIHSCNQFLWQAIVGPKGFALKIHRVLEYPPRQQLYIELKDRLRRKTNFTLNMRWYSRLIPEPEGFYVDQYDGGNGVKR